MDGLSVFLNKYDLDDGDVDDQLMVSLQHVKTTTRYFYATSCTVRYVVLELLGRRRRLERVSSGACDSI